MHRSRSPPPSKSADRVKKYLDIVKSLQAEHKPATRYDFYKKAMNQTQADRMIKYLEDNGFIKGDREKGYLMTTKGENMYGMLKDHADLVGLLTRELSGDRIKRW